MTKRDNHRLVSIEFFLLRCKDSQSLCLAHEQTSTRAFPIERNEAASIEPLTVAVKVT